MSSGEGRVCRSFGLSGNGVDFDNAAVGHDGGTVGSDGDGVFEAVAVVVGDPAGVLFVVGTS